MKRNRVKKFLDFKKKSRVRFKDSSPHTLQSEQLSPRSVVESFDSYENYHKRLAIQNEHLSPRSAVESFDTYEDYKARTASLPPRWQFSPQPNFTSQPFYTGEYKFDSVQSKFSGMDGIGLHQKRARRDAYPVVGPRFVPANTDSQMRGFDHGYYIHAAKLDHQMVTRDRENFNIVNRTVLTPRELASAAANSRYSSKLTSRRSSITEVPDKPRLYKANKRPLPTSNGGLPNGYHRDGAMSDVAMKIYRKKKRAPPPPAVVQTQMVQSHVQPLVKVSAVQTSIYPIEPPKDYEKKREEEVSEEEEIEVDIIPDYDQGQSSNFEPPPPPPPLPFMNESETTPAAPASSQAPTAIEFTKAPTSPVPTPANTDHVDQEAKDLKKQVEQAVINREYQRSVSDPLPREPTMQEKFAAELAAAYAKRQERREKGVVNLVQRQNSSTLFKAVVPKSPSTSVSEVLKPDTKEVVQVLDTAAKMNGSVKSKPERQSYLDEWAPADDLEEAPEKTSPKTKSSSKLSHSKSSNSHKESKGGPFKRMKKSIGKAFGSGRNLQSQLSASTPDQLYTEEEGWQIMYQDHNIDPPPQSKKSIYIKRVEVKPAFAYNSEKGQLVLLPSYDKIIVTSDNKRFRQSEMNQSLQVGDLTNGLSGKSKNKKPKKRPLSEIFDSADILPSTDRPTSYHEETVEKERQQQDLVEMQFALLQQLNKRPNGRIAAMGPLSKSTPNLSAEASFVRDEDLAMSMQNLDLQPKKKSKKLKKGQTKAPSSEFGGRSRSKVLQKGLNYYLHEHGNQSTANPVFTSDEEDDDRFDDPSHFSDSDTPVISTIPTPKPEEKHSDSGIGNGSVTSHSSSMSTVQAEVHTTTVDIDSASVSQQSQASVIYLPPAPPGFDTIVHYPESTVISIIPPPPDFS